VAAAAVRFPNVSWLADAPSTFVLQSRGADDCPTARYSLSVEHPPLDRWRDSMPAEVGQWLVGPTPPWWIAGGWAVDLHLGRQTRPHVDLDAGCFRDELAEIRRALDGWEFYAAHDGTLTRLGTEQVPAACANSVWCHPAGADLWWLQLLLEERDGTDWVFRRCRSVRRPAKQLTLATPDGVRYLRPEIQLLYKAKAAREKDRADLNALLPALATEERAWLADAIATCHPDHEWLGFLRPSESQEQLQTRTTAATSEFSG